MHYALEWLDVTLVGADRAAVTLLEPELSAQERMRLLSRSFPVPPATPRTVLLDLAKDRNDRWRRPWITACALLAGSNMPDVGFDLLARTLSEKPHVGDDDDHRWIVEETLVAMVQRQTAQHA